MEKKRRDPKISAAHWSYREIKHPFSANVDRKRSRKCRARSRLHASRVLRYQCRRVDVRTWTIIRISMPARIDITCRAWFHVHLHVRRLLPIAIPGSRETGGEREKDSYARMPFLARINAIEGKVRASHVHAPATRLESRDRSFRQLASARRLRGQAPLARSMARPWQNSFAALSPQQETRDRKSRGGTVPLAEAEFAPMEIPRHVGTPEGTSGYDVGKCKGDSGGSGRLATPREARRSVSTLTLSVWNQSRKRNDAVAPRWARKSPAKKVREFYWMQKTVSNNDILTAGKERTRVCHWHWFARAVRYPS